jgi:CubicO group peptidase (beta-lactamase class C family)
MFKTIPRKIIDFLTIIPILKLILLNFVKKNKFYAFIFLISVFFMNGMSSQSSGNQNRDYWPTVNWRGSTPAEHNVSKTKLDNMVTYIKDQNFAIDSVLIVKGGYIVFEEYFNPDYNKSTVHSVHSITKSVLSVFTGLAIEEGYIESLDQKILDFFPGRVYENPDPRKENITIRHLLTMTSGLEWDESISFDNPNNSLIQLLSSSSMVQYILDQPLATDPGTIWNYNTGEFHLLSAIISKASALKDQTIDEFVIVNIGLAIGITDVPWERDKQGYLMGGTGLFFTPRDIAKLGYLYLNNGSWNNRQLISKEWVTLTTTSCITADEYSEYCYGWWRDKELDIYYASGYAGQLLIPIPKHDMIVVFTANDEINWPYMDLVKEFVFPAVGEIDPGTVSGFLFDELLFTAILGIGILFLSRKKIK